MPRRRIGRFELLERLASGAFGDTYHAVDTVLDEEVALKVFKEPAWGIDALRAEVRPLVSVSHPNIIRYKDCNCFRDEDGKQILYIAMEFAKQGNIRKHLEGLSTADALSWCKQILEGVAECHRNNIIHGDLKPENILLSDGVIKIGDFGAACWGSLIGHRRGTPAYMAPEQWADPPELTRRTDLWAVGVTLYEMVYGHLPFRTKADIKDRGKQPPFAEVPRYPKLPDLLRKALNKDSPQRFQSATAFLNDLQECTPSPGNSNRRDNALLFYNRYTGHAEIYRFESSGEMSLIRAHQWRMLWDFIAGWADPRISTHCLLFAQSSAGWIEFYLVQQSGEILPGVALIQSEESLNQVVPVESELGIWLLRYNAASGTGTICQFSETGACVRQKKHVGWNPSWSQIVAARRRNSRLPGVLFYDAAAGIGEFYDIMADGEISLTRAHTGWSRSWSTIVSIDGAGHDGTVLLFYDQSACRGEFYSVEPDADIALLRAYDGWRSSWSRIVPIYNGPQEPPVLLFYDDTTGQGEFYRIGDGCQLTMVASREGWSKSWSHILALRV